jgi:S-formylglutathione hydrolase FrmB
MSGRECKRDSAQPSRLVIRALLLLLVLSPEVLAQQVEYKSFASKVLGREMRYGVYLPPSYASSPGKKYPVLYFLHGLFEDETRWSNRGGTDQIMNRMIADGKIGEFIVAIPYGGASFYTNTRDGSEKWEDAIVTDFIPMIESTYRVNASRTNRGISGTSMGGYGALKIAMKHPDLFGSASAHSAVLLEDLSAAKVSAGRLQRFQAMFDKIYGINQDLTYWEANNPMTLAKNTGKLNGLKLYFDCGTEDDYGFDIGAKQLDAMLTKAGYPHEAHLYPGGHGWDYAMKHTSESLLFHWKAFSGK